ncbi:hypothetical protein ELI73_28835, partial [Klebsiella pneumoniae]|nr:hypothetical protein [Klebsiella pneumoniae]
GEIRGYGNHLHLAATAPPVRGIYHNVALPAPLRRSEGVSGGYGIKQATNHPENRRKRAR